MDKYDMFHHIMQLYVTSEIVNMWILRHLLVFLMHLSLGTFAERFSNGYYYQDIVNGNGGSMLIYLWTVCHIIELNGSSNLSHLMF